LFGDFHAGLFFCFKEEATDNSSNMIFYRVPKDKARGNYTVVSNYYLFDPNLSGRAKGVFTYLLSCDRKNQDWYLYKRKMLENFADGKDALASAFKELEENGYVKTQAFRSGRRSVLKFTIYEIPEDKCSGIPLLKSKKEKGCADSSEVMSGNEEKSSESCEENPPLLNTSLKILTTESASIFRKVIEEELNLHLTNDFYENYERFLEENKLSVEDGSDYLRWIYKSRKNQVRKMDSFIYKVTFRKELLKEFFKKGKAQIKTKQNISTETVFCKKCKRQLSYSDIRQGFCPDCGTDINELTA